MNIHIGNPGDLVTSREETRAGFIAFALEKNRRAAPYIDQAKSLRVIASRASSPRDLLGMREIEKPLLTAAGLSDKAINYFREEDKNRAIEELIVNFLEPAGPDFIDEVVYRYLLIKGDSFGGSMRNIAGSLGEQKLTRSILSILRLKNISYRWMSKDRKTGWSSMPSDETLIEQEVKSIAWQRGVLTRVLVFNLKIPLVGKNVDVCLFDGTPQTYEDGEALKDLTKTILLGELKSGIDPAGADEHWKTASSALRRITDAFGGRQHSVKTVFIGAAIEKAMADEIYENLVNGQLSNAANLSNEEQLIEVCDWITDL